MSDPQRLAELDRRLRELSQDSEKTAKRLADLESVVASLRNRLDKVQSQLSGERQLRKWFPRI